MIPTQKLKEADQTAVNLFDDPKMIQAKLIIKLSELMDDRFKKAYLYGALEGKALVFYFSHNAIAYEFVNNLESFRSKIIPLYKELDMKENLYFTSIKAKTKHRPNNKEKPTEFFRDRAKGDFVIEVQDDALRASFEKLRKTIQDNNQKSKKE